ncbi:lantibiotic immunity ABC transporter MutG family permease subunit [Lactobacillus sp. ESL0785]|uniref:lantibiotic immunity ABC transporter MutG family permease subunit n=1 Tax=Lactobacillus sp. ESL0785 TaxID=2983232 RepID=UPI0023F74FC0|nr:lantibiotic immunity ABC transporter MutG family permease subunit [Lactobacillus sp. ESL0785]WEV71357.1 lantibiotic immunity ABC transporter MutG family permease subunit [Lactobacillus sp. ESL0785]
MKLLNLIQAEFFKLRHTNYFLIHMALPLLGGTLCAGYFLMTNYQFTSFLIDYFLVIALCYPFACSYACNSIFAQEISSDCFNLLSVTSRWQILLVKLFYLLIGSLVSCLMAIFTFICLLKIMRVKILINVSYLLGMCLLLWGSNCLAYLVHSFLELKFGHNVSLVCAALEFLLAALLLTDLGNLLWPFFPSSWGEHLVRIYTMAFFNLKVVSFIPIHFALSIIISLTLAMLIFSFCWFNQWEGRRNEG